MILTLVKRQSWALFLLVVKSPIVSFIVFLLFFFFFNLTLEAVASKFQRQARITVILGSLLIIVWIQMDLFDDGKDSPECVLMSINMSICGYQKGIEYSEEKSSSNIRSSWSDSVVTVLVPVFCLVVCYFFATSVG